MEIRNIKLILEYDGENYHGWQRQPRVVTLQGVVEETLAKIVQEKVNLIGASRTDAGVHARGQTANFRTKSGISLKNLKAALNSWLPRDVAIKSCLQAPDDFHARYDAKAKSYCYTILNSSYRSPFFRKYAYFFPRPLLDVTAMKRAAKFLVGKHDFSSFRGTATMRENKVRNLTRLRISSEKNFVRMDIEADGFLYNMVRIIAGTLLEVGRGKIAAGDVKRILRAKDRRLAGPTLPAQGLCLIRVKY